MELLAIRLIGSAHLIHSEKIFKTDLQKSSKRSRPDEEEAGDRGNVFNSSSTATLLVSSMPCETSQTTALVCLSCRIGL